MVLNRQDNSPDLEGLQARRSKQSGSQQNHPMVTWYESWRLMTKHMAWTKTLNDHWLSLSRPQLTELHSIQKKSLRYFQLIFDKP